MFGQSLLSGAFGGAACTTDTDQLFTSDVTATTIATYQLNGVTTSIPSNTYPGTASNITYAAGKFDNAAVFNGSSSLITLPDSSSISQENNFSLSFWIKPNGFVTYGTVFTFFSDYRNYVEISTGGIIRCNITGTTISAPSGSITNSVWQHVAITKSSTNGLVIYVNGSAVERNTSYTGNASDFRSSSYPNTIGAYKLTGSASDFFPGSMDQLRIFNTVLPQAAVTALYNETVATSSSADVNYQLANPNSIAYYKMSDATDQIGGNNLTNSNVNFNTEGKFGFAGKFNGSNSKLTISNSSFLPQGNNSRSISCWIKTTGGSSDGVIGYGNAVNSQAFVIYINNENKLGIFAYYNNTTGNIAISNNTWNHVVATYDGTNCRLYVNGVLDFTAAKTLNTGNGEFRIGGVNWNNSSEFFPGDIDQIRIYNSAISAANVTTLYEEIECPAAATFDVNFLVIAGGAGGGSNGGGGGAGGLRTTTTYGGSESVLSLSKTVSYNITVGSGGAGLLYPAGYQLVGPPGYNSVFDTITSLGGGGGGSNNVNAANGGSGGGGGSTPSGSTAFGLGTSGQGNNGGAGGSGGHPYRGGGGGGAGSTGSSASTGAGGSGKSVSITGSAVIYAGGGGGTGGTQGAAGGAGGSGGGGAGGQGSGGAAGQNATIVNSGSGGGSSGDAGPTGSGASGTVILRYLTASVSSFAVTGTLNTPTPSTVGTDSVLIFTTGTGTITFS